VKSQREHLAPCPRCGALIRQGKQAREHDEFCRKRHSLPIRYAMHPTEPRLVVQDNGPYVLWSSVRAIADERDKLRDALSRISDTASDPAFRSDAMNWIHEECRKVEPKS
jgi:hypothetical protein